LDFVGDFENVPCSVGAACSETERSVWTLPVGIMTHRTDITLHSTNKCLPSLVQREVNFLPISQVPSEILRIRGQTLEIETSVMASQEKKEVFPIFSDSN
jgi:hypothetical protein